MDATRDLHASPSAVADVSRWMARRTTRRGALGKISRVIIGTVGIGTVGIRSGLLTPPVAEASHECGYATWCGLCGKPCTSCGGTATTCPSGTSVGSNYWSYCCCFPDGYCWIVEYWDCCGYACSHTPQCYNNPDSRCRPGGAFPTWCPSGVPYNCSVALFVGQYPC